MNNFRMLREAGTWFRIFSVLLLLGSVAEAQWITDSSFTEVMQMASTARKPCNQPEATVPQVSVFERYSQTRREHEQEILVVFCAGTHTGAGCSLSVSPNHGRFWPVFLELESRDGLTVRYREGKKYQPGGTSIPAGFVTFLKVHVPKNAALGPQSLKGKLTFRDIQGAETSVEQQIAFEVPLAVVPHDAKVQDSGWPFKTPNPVWKNVKYALGVPFLVPAAAFLWVGCTLADCEF